MDEAVSLNLPFIVTDILKQQADDEEVGLSLFKIVYLWRYLIYFLKCWMPSSDRTGPVKSIVAKYVFNVFYSEPKNR